MADRKAAGEAVPIVGQVEVVIVRRSAVERRLIGAASVETCRKRSLGYGVAVVGVDAEAAQNAGQEGEALLPLRLDTLDVRIGTVDRQRRLPLFAIWRGTLRTKCAAVVIHEICDGVDRIGEVLVKISKLQNAQRLEVVLDEDIEVVALRRHQGGVAGLDGRVGRLV